MSEIDLYLLEEFMDTLNDIQKTRDELNDEKGTDVLTPYLVDLQLIDFLTSRPNLTRVSVIFEEEIGNARSQTTIEWEKE